MTVRSFIQNTALIAVSILSVLLLLECGVRSLIQPTDLAVYRPDPLVGYRLEPNQRGRYKTTEIDGSFDVNEMGYNNQHRYQRERIPGRFRVALLGDSYVEAIHVHPKERMFDVLEERLHELGLDTEIYTFAASGFGTGQELLLLENEVLQFNPDLVIVLFVNNDLRDTACSLREEAPKPCFYLDEESRLSTRPFQAHRPSHLGRLLLHSAMFRYLFLQRGLLDRLRKLDGQRTNRIQESMLFSDPSPEWVEAWRVTDACLREMGQRTREAGATLLVVNRPPIPLLEQNDQPDPPEGIDYWRPAQRLSEFAATGGFTFHDLTPSFQQAAAEGRGPFHFPHDAHWNAAGHLVAAEAMVNIVREALLTHSRRRGGS